MRAATSPAPAWSRKPVRMNLGQSDVTWMPTGPSSASSARERSSTKRFAAE